MNIEQARRVAEDLLSDEELDAISNGINGIQPQMCLRDTRRMMAKKAIAAALVKFTEWKEPFVRAGFRDWVTHDLYTHPAPSQQEGSVVVSKVDGKIVAVTRQDEEGHILKVIAESSQQEKRKPLTDDQLRQMRLDAKSSEDCANEYWFILFARAIEAAHNIKEQPK